MVPMSEFWVGNGKSEGGWSDGTSRWWIGDLPPQNYEPDDDEEEDDFMGVGI